MRHKQKRDQETETDEDIESEHDVFNYSHVETEDISLTGGQEMKKSNNWSTPHVLLDNRENRFFGSGRMEASEKRYKAKLTTKDKKHDERGAVWSS